MRFLQGAPFRLKKVEQELTQRDLLSAKRDAFSFQTASAKWSRRSSLKQEATPDTPHARSRA